MNLDEQSVNTPPQKAKRKVQFSLAVLLSASLLFGATLLYFLTYRELQNAKAENRRLRVELGQELEIINPNLLHSNYQVNASKHNSPWRWRIYLPLGEKYRLRFTEPGKIVTENDFPLENIEALDLPSGEFDLEIVLSIEGALTVNANSATTTKMGYEYGLLDKAYQSSFYINRYQTETATSMQRLTLKRFIKRDGNGPARPNGNPGLLIWIEHASLAP